jgi:hypothetical protein
VEHAIQPRRSQSGNQRADDEIVQPHASPVDPEQASSHMLAIEQGRLHGARGQAFGEIGCECRALQLTILSARPHQQTAVRAHRDRVTTAARRHEAGGPLALPALPAP